MEAPHLRIAHQLRNQEFISQIFSISHESSSLFHESSSLSTTLTRLHFQGSPQGSHICTAGEAGLLVGTGLQLSVPDWAGSTGQSCSSWSVLRLSSSRETQTREARDM